MQLLPQEIIKDLKGWYFLEAIRNKIGLAVIIPTVDHNNINYAGGFIVIQYQNVQYQAIEVAYYFNQFQFQEAVAHYGLVQNGFTLTKQAEG